jgi:hypothetical protein
LELALQGTLDGELYLGGVHGANGDGLNSCSIDRIVDCQFVKPLDHTAHQFFLQRVPGVALHRLLDCLPALFNHFKKGMEGFKRFGDGHVGLLTGNSDIGTAQCVGVIGPVGQNGITLGLWRKRTFGLIPVSA